MRHLLIVALLLGGCATTNTHNYGNYLKPSEIAVNKEMAADSAKQLSATYSPAATRIELKQPTSDEYGGSLIKLLRAKGYAVAEYNSATTLKSTSVTNQHINLQYVIDKVAAANFYRTTLLINNQPLSRVYTAQNGVLRPAGAWVKRSD
jgi:Conjugal transfer protein TrbH